MWIRGRGLRLCISYNLKEATLRRITEMAVRLLIEEILTGEFGQLEAFSYPELVSTRERSTPIRDFPLQRLWLHFAFFAPPAPR